ncbi:MAG: hypothetical protein ACK55Z_16990, partial [bacterium]
TTWAQASNLHIMNDSSDGGYLATLSVSRHFGLTALVADYYGNIVLSHHPSVNISLVEDLDPSFSLTDRVIGAVHTYISPQDGQATFKNLHIDVTGARCERTKCILPYLRLQVITTGTNSSRNHAVVYVLSSAFQVHHDVVGSLKFAVPPAASFVAETRAPALY